MNRTILCGLCLTLAAVGAILPAHAQDASSKKLTKITLLTNYAFLGRHVPFFVGAEKGFYKDAGFDVNIQPSSGSGFVITAVDNGQADYGMADASSVVLAAAKGAHVKGFLVYVDVQTSGLGSLKPYETLESLQGATISASLADNSRVILPILYEQKGLDPSKIKWQAADPNVYISLLLNGQTDLYPASLDGDLPNLRDLAAAQGKKAYFSSFAGWGYDVFGYFLIADAKRIAEKPEQVKAFAAATKKAVEYAVAHPEEAARIMVKRNPTLKYDWTIAQWTQSIKAIETESVKKHGYGVATPDRLQKTIDLVKRTLKLNAELKPETVFAPGFVAN